MQPQLCLPPLMQWLEQVFEHSPSIGRFHVMLKRGSSRSAQL